MLVVLADEALHTTVLQSHTSYMRIIKPSILAVVHHPDIFWCWGLAQAIMIAARQHMQMLTGRSQRCCCCWAVGIDGMGWFPDDAGLCWTLKAVHYSRWQPLKSAHWSVVKFGVMIQFKRTRFITWVGICEHNFRFPHQNGPTCEILQFTQIETHFLKNDSPWCYGNFETVPYN